MRIRTLAAASLSALSCLLTSNHAQAAMVDITTTLSGLSYRLIDLAPEDGIAPSLMFSTSSKVGLATYSGEHTNSSTTVLAGGVFNGVAGQVTSGGGTAQASYSPGLISASLSVGGDDLPSQGSGYQATFMEIHGTLPTDDYPFPVEGEGDMSFILSPHTALVIEADVSVQHAVNQAAYLGSAHAQTLANNQQTLTALSFSGVYMSLGQFNDLAAPEAFQAQYASEADFLIEKQHSFDQGDEFSLERRTLVVGIANGLDTEQALTFRLEGGAMIDFFTYLTDYPGDPGGGIDPVDPVDPIDPIGPIGGGGGVAPAIPEPSTWALMGLGLLGVAGATRRHAAGAQRS